MTPRYAKFKAVIKERPEGGWRISWSDGQKDEDHPTAIEAQQAVRARSEALARTGLNNMFVIEWQSATKVGRLVVGAIT